MKKSALTMFVIMFFALSSAFSQINTYGELVISTKENVKPALGFGVKYLHPINNGLFLGGNIGYRQTISSDYFGGQIPIMAIGRYYVNQDENGFYPQASLGLVYSYSRIKVMSTNIKSSSTNFGFNLGAGYKIGESYDIGLLFENITYENGSSSAFILRLAYTF